MPQAEVGRHAIHYVRRGEGEPLLLIQGLSGTHLSWGDPFLGALEPGYDLIAYDHRGIGRSGPLEGSFTIADLAGDAAGLLGALGIEQAHVVGISMGGMVAQELAIAHPELVATLTLGCTYPGGVEGRLTDQAVIARLIGAFSSGSADVAMRTSWEVNVSAEFAGRPGAFEEFSAMARELPAPLPVLFEQLRATAVHETAGRLSSVTAPTLVIHGDEDQMLAPANGEAIARIVPGARLELLEGTGHLFWWERPERSAELIRAHLAAHPLGGAPAPQ